jgi:hypothetical protein
LPPWETPLGQALARWAFSAEYLSLRAPTAEAPGGSQVITQVDPQGKQ